MPFDTFETFNYRVCKDREVMLAPVDKLSRELAHNLYRGMVRLRKAEEGLFKEYHPADEIRCPVHFCIGEEAVPSALYNLIQRDDYVFSHHRSHGYYFAKGAPLNALFAEMYGKETGANAGKAGSQDISYGACNFHSGAILAGGVPIAAGVAYALKLNKKPFIAVSGFGDGATDEGILWETANYASLRKLPLLLICENNNYSTFSPQSKRSATCNIAERVSTFGIKCHTVYGNDVVQVHDVLKDCIDHCRSGKGPAFIEAFTYRWNGHVGPENDDVNGYRPDEELKFWKANCPIKLMEERLIKAHLLTPQEKEKIHQEADAEVAAAFKFAKESKFPSITDFGSCNISSSSPLADKLLRDEKSVVFDENQKDLIPGPY